MTHRRRCRAALTAAAVLFVLLTAGVRASGAPSEPGNAPATPTAPTEATPPPSPARQPLPPFLLKSGNTRTILGPDGEIRSVVVENGVEFSIGDVRVRATRVEYDPRTLGFVAEGEVVFERGDETIRAARLVYDPETGMGVADEAVAVSPPFYVSGRRLERGPRGLTVRDALVAACPEGPRSELRLAAREVRFVDGRYVDVRGARPYLFGTRLFTLPRIRQPVDQGERARNQFGLALPVRARVSGVSGVVVGLAAPFTLGQNIEGEALVELPARHGVQYALTLERDLLRDLDLGVNTPSPASAGRPPRPFAPNPAGPNESALRAFLRARPNPPRDDVLDWEDITPEDDRLSFPLRGASRFLHARLVASANRDVTNRRFGSLLLSQLPALELSGRIPLAGNAATAARTTNAAGRSALRAARPVFAATVSGGYFRERIISLGDESPLAAARETPDAPFVPGRTASRLRLSGLVEVGLLPLLLGDRLLVRPGARLIQHHYGGSGRSSYSVAEADFAATYVLGPRTGIGGRYIARSESGATPFLFDQIESRSEAQVRAQAGFAGGRYTLGSLFRYDLDKSDLFDYEIALAVRTRCLEPRVFYRKLGGTLGFTIALPGITTR